jgi:hypothetical protein
MGEVFGSRPKLVLINEAELTKVIGWQFQGEMRIIAEQVVRKERKICLSFKEGFHHEEVVYNTFYSSASWADAGDFLQGAA